MGNERRTTSRTREDVMAGEMVLTLTRMTLRPKDRATSRRLHKLLIEGRIAPRHLRAFALVALEGPVSVSELAERQGLAVSTASLLVTQLAEVGMLVRREDEKDRRRTVVSIAPAHRRESEEVLESVLSPLRRAFKRLGAQRGAALLRDLGIVAEEIARCAVGEADEGLGSVRLAAVAEPRTEGVAPAGARSRSAVQAGARSRSAVQAVHAGGAPKS